MNKLGGLFKKLKSIKHIEIILAILLGLIILLVYFSATNSTSSVQNETKSTSNLINYTTEIESKLENLLESIDGAGNVTVMVMCEKDIELDTTTVPSITSVVVVSSGAKVFSVKLDIIKAVQVLLNLQLGSIEVITGSE